MFERKNGGYRGGKRYSSLPLFSVENLCSLFDVYASFCLKKIIQNVPSCHPASSYIISIPLLLTNHHHYHANDKT